MGRKTARKKSRMVVKGKRTRRPTPKALTAATGGLTAAQVASLPRPRANYEELVDKAVMAWKRHGAEIHVPGLTAGKLSARVKASRRAQEAQRKVEAAFEKRLRPVRDRRLVADALAWKGLLDLWAFVKPAAQRFPEIARDFRFLAEGISTRRGEASSVREEEPARA